MIAIPAIDLKEGRVVQLVGGQPDQERISLPDPATVARRWIDAGFSTLHVVDLDAALGSGTNRAAIAAVLDVSADMEVTLQVGGGIRDDESAQRLLAEGADRVIVGTRAVEDPGWLESLTARHPGAVVVAADVRGNEVVTRGWTARAGLDITEFCARLESLPLAAVLVTDVDREGSMSGADAARFAFIAAATRHPLQAAGGIGDLADLRTLAAAGAAGAVLGMSLYTGRIEAADAAAAFPGRKKTVTIARGDVA